MSSAFHSCFHIVCLVAISFVCLPGCSRHSSGPPGSDAATVIEGVIFSLEYELEDGGTGGFTRSNSAGAVPGGNGNWNVDAHGRLTDQYLIITYPQQKDLGPHVIPSRRLVNVRFGDGGIESVNESQPAAPE
jgi:hypothetical protein